MDTLRKLRPVEKIVIYDTPIMEKNDIPYIHMALIENPMSIIVIKNYADEIIDKVLDEIDPENSGYVFFDFELDLDPVNNQMVPLHRYAIEEEIESLKERKILVDKLPILKMKDSIRRWYNFTLNSIVAIERSDKSVYFRICK